MSPNLITDKSNKPSHTNLWNIINGVVTPITLEK